jgi:hypothetical protein
MSENILDKILNKESDPTATDPNKEFRKDFEELLKKYNLTMKVTLEFPEYKILPTDVQLALIVISKHKNMFITNFVKKEEKDAN